VTRILDAVVRVEGGLDSKRRLAAFAGTGFDPSARSASPSRESAVLQPDYVSRHSRIFSHMFCAAGCDSNHISATRCGKNPGQAEQVVSPDSDCVSY
jgi:hypothetical protein